jgi:hypothetical protein
MRRFLAAILFLLLAPAASEQLAAGQARMAPTQAEIAAQASFDTSYLLWVYMTQLAAAGAAPTQADIDKATQQYFTNGAEVTGVPTSGPGAAYFQKGAEVTAYSAWQGTAAPEAEGEGGSISSLGGKSSEQEAGRQAADAGRQGNTMATTETTEEAMPIGAAASHPAVTLEVPSEASLASSAELPPTGTGLTCSPREIEAAMAIARQFATVPAPLPSATSSARPIGSIAVPSPGSTPSIIAARPMPICPSEPARNSFQGPSLSSRIAFALSGAFLGGFAVALLRARG